MPRKTVTTWKFIDRLLLPIIFFLSSFVVVLTFWQLLLGHRRAEIRAVTNDQALFVKSKMESELAARILPLERLAAQWQVLGNDQGRKSAAELMMSGYPAYQAVEWADPELHVRWVAPSRGNETDLGGDLTADPTQQVELRAAEQSSNVVVTRPVSLRQGGRGLLVCVPVYSPQALRGFVVGVFRYQELIPSILRDTAQGYWVVVYDGDEEIYGEGLKLAPRDAAWASTVQVRFRDLTWRAQIWPKPGTITYALSTLPKVFFIGGILLSALLALTVYSAETAKVHAREAIAANKELKSEIAGRKLAEEAMRQSQKMEAVGRLAGGVAHDFNNLLTVIRGYAALSLNRVGADSVLFRELNEILKTTDRASALTRRLLAFSRKQVLQLRVLDLNTLVAQVNGLLPPVLGEDIELVLDLDPDLGRVKADSAQMEQAIMNLVFNARDAMPHGGKLKIHTTNVDLDEEYVRHHEGAQAGPHVMLAVSDTGHGMSDETLAHVFEPFFTTKDISKGTGLGLATVYGTLRQSGGFITVSSKVGEGTTFQIYLPRVAEAIAIVEALVIAPQRLDGAETILVIEDDDAVRRMTREFLKIKGYTVVEARGATEAIQAVMNRGDQIDLVLTDVLMPGMKGRELVERLAELRSDLKVLYMSAYTEDAAINIGVLNPGTEFIEKPFSPDELAAKVRQVLERKPKTHNASAGQL
jgi:signal transduction histidine kinase/ActR/RegA family two-component response regulator